MTTKHDCLTMIAHRITTRHPLRPTDPGRDYDLEAIAEAYHREQGTWDIDQCAPAPFWALVNRHSTLDCYRPEATEPTSVPPTGRVAIGDRTSTGDHDLHLVNLDGLDVALELIRIVTDHAADARDSTAALADLIGTVRTMTGEATEAVLIVAIRELITEHLPLMLDPATVAGFHAELVKHNTERPATAQVPSIRPTRSLPPTPDTQHPAADDHLLPDDES